MTSTVLITLDAPIQSWNSKPGNKYRVTDHRPTKTGVIGLLANALGRDYDDSIDDLAALNYAVRCDRAGRLERDHRSVGDHTGLPALPGDWIRGLAAEKSPHQPRPMTRHLPVKNADPTKPGVTVLSTPKTTKANAKQITDVFLADAAFTAALTGNTDLIRKIAGALAAPARALFLGKKAHPPAEPLFLTVTDHDDPVAALHATPAASRCDPAPWQIWYTTSADNADGQVTYDQPVRYGARPVRGPRVEAIVSHGDPAPAAEPASLSDFFA